ncbi:MAG: ORF6N domain-containing protein [Planctomycetota bacterium]
MATPDQHAVIQVEHIAHQILVVRGLRVMLDADLAEIYGVSTKRLNEQVKRNRRRFPEDFMFRLTSQEAFAVNRSQIATSSQKHRDPRHRPYAFTEHGAVMLASVSNTASRRAPSSSAPS